VVKRSQYALPRGRDPAATCCDASVVITDGDVDALLQVLTWQQPQSPPGSATFREAKDSLFSTPRCMGAVSIPRMSPPSADGTRRDAPMQDSDV
jgi:hypothetical protein